MTAIVVTVRVAGKFDYENGPTWETAHVVAAEVYNERTEEWEPIPDAWVMPTADEIGQIFGGDQ